MAKTAKNLGASVRSRLLNLARRNNQAFDLVLTRFAVERALFRLCQSAHSARFVLKGAMLMATWFDDPHRATRDLDLAGYGDPDEEAILNAFRDILSQKVEDGIEFDITSLRVDRIREQLDYGGLRLRASASVNGAKVPLSIDIGFGDALEPEAEVVDYPTLLDFPTPRLRAYARETVIAEKFQAMVVLGRANSRMKDFYDIWVMSQSFRFDDDRLAQAIKATFARRTTTIPLTLPDALTEDFATDRQKQQQWQAFLEEVAMQPGPLEDVIGTLAVFLMPHAVAAKEIISD